MTSLNTTTVSINKANTQALRAMVKPGETVNALVNRLLAEKLAELAVYKARRLEMFPESQQADDCKEAHICHFLFTIITTNILTELNVETVGDLVKLTEAEIRQSPYFKRSGSTKRIVEIKQALARIGLQLAG